MRFDLILTMMDIYILIPTLNYSQNSLAAAEVLSFTDILPWECLSNDLEDHLNQHDNAHKQCHEIKHSVMNSLEIQ